MEESLGSLSLMIIFPIGWGGTKEEVFWGPTKILGRCLSVGHCVSVICVTGHLC